MDREEHREALALRMADPRLPGVHDTAVGLHERLPEPLPIGVGGIRAERHDARKHGDRLHQYWNPGSTTGSGGIDGGRELTPGVMRT